MRHIQPDIAFRRIVGTKLGYIDRLPELNKYSGRLSRLVVDLALARDEAARARKKEREIIKEIEAEVARQWSADDIGAAYEEAK